MNNELIDRRCADEEGDVPLVLEEFAHYLDDRRYPGLAWPAARARRARQTMWRKGVSAAAAIAATIGAAFLYWQFSPVPQGSGSPDAHTIARTDVPVKNTVPGGDVLPQIFIVEDLDSYSLFDFSGGVPMVAFAWKDSWGFECVTLMATTPSEGAATRKAGF